MSKKDIPKMTMRKTSLKLDKRYESSMARLTAMGLKFYTETVGDDECYIVIDVQSIVKLIDSKITYPSRETFLSGRDMVIHFWRGGMKVGNIKP